MSKITPRRRASSTSSRICPSSFTGAHWETGGSNASDDVGTTLADLVVMREVTRHTAGATTAAQQALPATAFGVFEALRAAAEVCLGRSDLEGLRVAVQGLGNVGMPLCGYLSAAGAALVVSDLDANRCARAAATYGATVAALEEVHA